MEAVSSVTAIFAVIQFTGSVVQLCGGYIKEVKNAREDIGLLQDTVKSLQTVLYELSDLLSSPRGEKLRTSSQLRSHIDVCSTRLEDLEDKINPGDSAGKGKQLMKRFGVRALKWPLKRAETDSIVQGLGRDRETFLSALQIDGT